eukprot:3710010-Prymnesium_polylepis.1
MASAPRARAAAEALTRFELCRLLGGGDWRAGLRLLLRELKPARSHGGGRSASSSPGPAPVR